MRAESIRFFLIFLMVYFIAPAGAYAAVSAEEAARQNNLALDYQLRLSRTVSDAVEERERLYLALVEECPETEAAQEALWSLANLYLDDFDEPQETKAQEVLEYFIKKYPSSPWIFQAENRLLWLYEGTGNYTRILPLFEGLLQRAMPLSVRLPLVLRCARACENAGFPDKAREWYARILKDGGSGAYPEIAVAKTRLAALKKN